MSETLSPQPWMKHPGTIAVMAALEAAGGAGCARFVGGCVRNALLRKPVDDIDIATVLTPDQTIAALKAAGLKAIPTGVDHGTVTAIAEGRPFEVTTLRRDVETDGRRAVVAFTQDWSEDAQRRDFRLNALYCDADGTLHDPTGGGLADLRAGRIVFVGEAETRIREDALRILRFFRFLAWYGRGEPDATALAACQALRDLTATLSAERVSKELLKLLAAEDPRAAVSLMARTGVLSVILPEARGLSRFERLVTIETEMLFSEDAELRLASLLPDDPAVGLAVAQRLRLSNAQRDRLVAALGTEPKLVSWMSPRQARQIIYRIGLRPFLDRVTLAWAASERQAATTQWRALLPLGQSWSIPSFPLTGDEVAAAGVPRGPLMGAVMREVEDWWVDNDFIDDKLSIVERLKAVAQGMVY
ncbi:CCA tRNA nucleotidyltransferase [Caulobacter sp. KR2-114]|uniref:CCA tRNA nucleotidyltransferase n=1 Tax=Caulobacter sp. KR2-114 TaxID=3400912 RepID=UPI003C044F7F